MIQPLLTDFSFVKARKFPATKSFLHQDLTSSGRCSFKQTLLKVNNSNSTLMSSLCLKFINSTRISHYLTSFIDVQRNFLIYLRASNVNVSLQNQIIFEILRKFFVNITLNDFFQVSRERSRSRIWTWQL
jgi:hypothetical protein